VTPNSSPGITIEASDTEGLNSLEITCRAVDLRYHTQLPRAAAGRQFSRSFTLSDLFPQAGEWKYPVRLEVAVRNTRGATATTEVQVPSPPIPKTRQ
jgi:hypothetical protein